MSAMVYVCSTIGAGVDFVTPVLAVAEAWSASNTFRYYTLAPVRNEVAV